MYTWPIHSKEAKNIPLRKEHLFNKWYYEKWKATCKRMKLNSSKWIIELNIRTTTVNLRRNIGVSSLTSVLATGLFLIFFFLFFVFDTKSKDNKTGKKAKKQVWLHQTNKLMCGKISHRQEKRQPTEWEQIFPKHISDKGLIPKI